MLLLLLGVLVPWAEGTNLIGGRESLHYWSLASSLADSASGLDELAFRYSWLLGLAATVTSFISAQTDDDDTRVVAWVASGAGAAVVVWLYTTASGRLDAAGPVIAAAGGEAHLTAAPWLCVAGFVLMALGAGWREIRQLASS